MTPVWVTIIILLACFAALPRCATSLAATITAGISWTYTNVLTGSINTQNANSHTYSQKLTNGTGASGTADLLYAVKTTIAGAGSTTLDLAGTLTDFFGNVLTMARAKYMYFNLTADTTASDVSIGNATAPLLNWISAATSTVKVRNGGLFLLGGPDATGYAVTATTADGLKVLNNDATNTATLKLAVIGSSA